MLRASFMHACGHHRCGIDKNLTAITLGLGPSEIPRCMDIRPKGCTQINKNTCLDPPLTRVRAVWWLPKGPEHHLDEVLAFFVEDENGMLAFPLTAKTSAQRT